MSDITLIRTPEYEIRGEFLWFGVVLHGDVRVPWTKGVRSRVRSAMAQIASSLTQPCWAFQAPSHDPKKRKFIQDVGGTYHHRRLTGDGEWADMFLFPVLE